MNPAAIPYEIENDKPMKIDVKKAGMATAKSAQSIFLNSPIIMIPTMIKIGAVAADGTMDTNGDKTNMAKKPREVTTFVKPVRPPDATPVADSIKVVVFDVPTTPANVVVNVSTTKARSIFELKELSATKASWSFFEKIPVWFPIPINVPMASNKPVSPMAKTVTTANDVLAQVDQSEPIPFGPKAAPKAFVKSAKAFGNDVAADKCVLVTPIGIPIKVVAINVIKNDAGTFLMTKKVKINKPIKAKRTDDCVKRDSSGVTPDVAITEVIPSFTAPPE